MAILVFWVVMPCCHTGGYQCSGGILAMKIETLYSSKTLEITCKTVWCLISEDYSWHLHCCEVKLTSLHCEGIKGEYRRYISYLYLTLVLIGWAVSITPQLHFTPGERILVPIGWEAGWATELVWLMRPEEKSCIPAGDRTPVMQSVVSLCTEWITAAYSSLLWEHQISVYFFFSWEVMIHSCRKLQVIFLCRHQLPLVWPWSWLHRNWKHKLHIVIWWGGECSESSLVSSDMLKERSAEICIAVILKKLCPFN
jgi:hypothetical protein